jgi:aspartyl/asparaginyl beta-hydroxylase (cupin superfamily)
MRVEAYLGGSARRDGPPLQRPLQWFPGLTAKPWHDPGDFPWTAGLEAAHEEIRGKLREVQALGFLRHHKQGLDERGSWTTYRLFAAGRKLEDQCRRCPETTRIVESIPDVCATGLVYFSVLSPGTHLAAHCGPTNTRLRCHLGLVVPRAPAYA